MQYRLMQRMQRRAKSRPRDSRIGSVARSATCCCAASRAVKDVTSHKLSVLDDTSMKTWLQLVPELVLLLFPIRLRN